MTRPTHALRLNALELLRQPGSERAVRLEIAPVELDVDDPRITGEVQVDVTATSTLDGIVVRGTVAAPWSEPCRRCLNVVSGRAVAEVDELYRHDGDDADAFEIVGDQIDLAPAVREHVLLALPDGPLCRDECAGICPACGIDRNTATCDCDLTVRDDRWAALDQLRLDDQ